ncbi:MAG TPA: ABC transporter ATP-binding protein [Gemmataceae bacterium]|jgi:energy-coupling factor transporter ATP-binding protein EcfA2|nr:ABC transporter ATP-binding protein [Gemmataceae bacterium]
MLQTTVHVSSPIARTPRVLQVEGLFDLPPAQKSEMSWQVSLPLDERCWHIGLIVGASGCGKSTIARSLWPSHLAQEASWPRDRAVVDGFPCTMSIKDIVSLLCAVGFSSPPAWLRPFALLSTGQQFRVRLARLLAEQPELAVMDEFSSVVDRTVAQIGSHALAKTVRGRGQKFIAVTCHEDVEPWLNPDWVYRPDTGTFTWRLLQRRPAICLQICRVERAAWTLFKPHHYLSTALAPSAVCFGALWRERLVAFSAWIHSLTRQGGKREHRTVTLPDYQGVGIGHALSSFVASLWKGLGQRATSTTTHPAFVASRLRSRDWRLIRAPALGRRDRRGGIRHAVARLTAGFEYVGPALQAAVAKELLDKGEL